MNLTIIFILVFTPVSAIASDCGRIENDITTFDAEILNLVRVFQAIPAEAHNKAWVAKKINHMVEVDQHLRETVMQLPFRNQYNETEKKCFWDLISARWQQIDETNTNDLKQLMELYTWFTISNFGEVTSHQAWLLAQHADRNPSFQKEVLRLMETFHPQGEVSSKDYAYLHDRVTWYVDGKPQRYATQGRCIAAGNWQQWEVEDIENLETRRFSMKMETFAANKARLDLICH